MNLTPVTADANPPLSPIPIPSFVTKVSYKIEQSESEGLVSSLPRISVESVNKAIEQLKEMYADLEMFEKGIYEGLQFEASQPVEQSTNTNFLIDLFCKHYSRRIMGFSVIQDVTTRVMNTFFVNTISTHSESNLHATQTSAQKASVVAMETDIPIPPSIVTHVSLKITQSTGDSPISTFSRISLESMENTKEQISKMLADLEVFEKGFTVSRSASEDYHRRIRGFMHVLVMIDAVCKYIFSSKQNSVTASYINTIPKPMTMIHDERVPTPTSQGLNRNQICTSCPKRTRSEPTKRRKLE